MLLIPEQTYTSCDLPRTVQHFDHPPDREEAIIEISDQIMAIYKT